MIKLLGPKAADTNFPSNRIEAFSDGVIAIIITLMVLEIHAPHDIHSVSGLAPMVPHLVAYLLSFVMLGIYWVNHHNFFHKIEKANRPLLWLNLNLLFWMSIIPIPTAILGDHHTEGWASLIYGFVLFMNSASFTYMGVYAGKKGLFTGKIPDDVKRRNMRRNLFSLGLYIVAMAAGYIHVYISFAIFVFVAAMYFMPRLGIRNDEPKKQTEAVPSLANAKTAEKKEVAKEVKSEAKEIAAPVAPAAKPAVEEKKPG